MCEARCTVWGMPDSLVLEAIRFDPKPRIFGNRIVTPQGLWSNDGQPGPSPRKHHQPPLGTHFGQLLVKLVKTQVKTH
jgi:hypothetical protein